jgi:L-ascorbate metabolism protein UlaG (beta-lactamase superfamily)
MDDLTWIGTATTLLRLGPFTLLTDPNFLHRGEFAYLGYGLVSRRLTEPALALDALPRLDAIVLSHLHGDHWDRRAQAGLDRGLPVLTTPAAAKTLRRRKHFGAAVGLATWEQHRLTSPDATLTVTALPGAHSTNRVLHALLPPVMGTMLELGDAEGRTTRRVYLTGDTMPIEAMTEIGARGAIDTTVIHVGGTTLPGGFTVTMTGPDAVDCLRMVHPKAAIPVHHGDYGVFKEPITDTLATLRAADLDLEIREVARGATVPL